jgi:hypothetical protein
LRLKLEEAATMDTGAPPRRRRHVTKGNDGVPRKGGRRLGSAARSSDSSRLNLGERERERERNRRDTGSRALAHRRRRIR